MVPYIVAVLIGYAFGCIQMAFILGKVVRHIDIRQHGTTNAGASNAVIVLGWKYGVMVGVGDYAKGLLAVLIVSALYPTLPPLAFVAGVAAIMGHIFPAPLGFRGGKGIATLLGALLGLNFWAGLVALLFLIAITVLSDFVAVGSIALYLALPALAWLLFRYPDVYVALAVGLMLLGVYKHLSNVKKILNKQEVGLRAVMRPKE